MESIKNLKISSMAHKKFGWRKMGKKALEKYSWDRKGFLVSSGDSMGLSKRFFTDSSIPGTRMGCIIYELSVCVPRFICFMENEKLNIQYT